MNRRRPNLSCLAGGQSQPKAANPRRSIVPSPQAERIVQRFVAGQSIRSIAKAENRDRVTVTKIVKGPEVLQLVATIRAQFFGAAEIAMQVVVEELRNPNNRTRGQMAYQLLKDAAVIPTEHQRELLSAQQQIVPEDCHRERVKQIMSGLMEGAIARCAAYGLPLTEIEGDLKNVGGKINYETGRVEPIEDEL